MLISTPFARQVVAFVIFIFLKLAPKLIVKNRLELNIETQINVVTLCVDELRRTFPRCKEKYAALTLRAPLWTPGTVAFAKDFRGVDDRELSRATLSY